MSEYRVFVDWQHGGGEFAYDSFNRSHKIRYGGGQEIWASSAPEYAGVAEHVNPEEALAAALASCHMLTFLALCAKKRLPVASYRDEAVASLGKNEAGQLCVSHIGLNPQVAFSGVEVDAEQLKQLHERAHQACFIANSIRSEVGITPRF